MIGNEQYLKKVYAPTVKQLLSLSTEDFGAAMDACLQEGDIIDENDNTFQAFSVCVDNYQDIQNVYYKLKYKFASARHIVCAFRIPGIHTYECDDYCDDGDNSCGRSLLKWMVENEITCRAFFVVRNVGQKLGGNRFNTYITAAENVLKAYPMNAINNKDQTPKSPKANSPTGQIMPISRRGEKTRQYVPPPQSLSQKRGAFSKGQRNRRGSWATHERGAPPLRGKQSPWSRQYDDYNSEWPSLQSQNGE